MKTTKEFLKYTFTKAETEQHSQELARQIQALQWLEDQRKEVVANLKAQIEAASGTARDLSQKITNGYEYRDIECDVLLNDPQPGRKSVYRRDTAQFVREMTMDADELQGDLPLDADGENEPEPEKTTKAAGPKVTHRTATLPEPASGGARANA